MATKIRWGIIGAGLIATKFAEDMGFTDNGEVMAIASSKKEKADAFAKKFQLRNAYDDYTLVVNDSAVDAIYVATPHSFHKEHSLLALNAGKHVLCEKPVAMNKAELQAVLAKAKEKGLFFMEGLWTDFLPHISYIKSVVDSGGIGAIKYLAATFGFPFTAEANPRLFDYSIGGGSLLDLGIYPIYLAYKFLGKPDVLQALAIKGTNGVDLQCAMQFHYNRGADAQLFSCMDAPVSNTAEIIGTEGKISIPASFQGPVETVTITYSNTGETAAKKFEKSKGSGLEYQLQHVNESIGQGKKESEVWSFQHSLDVMGLLDEVRRQIGLVYPADDTTLLS